MKNVILYFLFTYFSLSAFSQELPNLLSPTKISTIAYFRNGDKVRYKITEESTKFKTNSDKILSTSTSTCFLDLAVVDSTEHSYVFEAKYVSQEYKSSDGELEKMLNQLQFESVIRYQTDEFGQFDTILNLEELKNQLIDKLEDAKELASKEMEKEKAEVFSLIITAFIDRFEELEDVEALFLTDLIEIHSIYGWQMQIGKPQDVEVYYPTIGDLSLSGTGKINLVSITKPKDEARISISTKPNKDELMEYMSSFLLLFALDGTKRIKFSDAKVSMSTKTTYKMRLSDGWMQEIESKSQTSVSDEKHKAKRLVTKTYLLED